MMNVLPYIYVGAGILALHYFFLLRKFCGHVPAFGNFWAGAGIFGIVFGILWMTGAFSQILPGIILLTEILGIVFLGICGWVWYLLRQGNRKAEPGADYVIVLGAKVNGTAPSKALYNRIITAYGYLMENPEAKAVLTGGKGADEGISEAACMKEEFLRLGLSEERILMEEQSRTTVENLVFAGEMIQKELQEQDKEKLTVTKISSPVLIVTNDFHVLRGTSVARVAGYERAEGLGAPSADIMKLHYYMRETFSWMKFGLHGLRRKLFPSTGI